jgi:hypothetical protein
MVQVRSVVKCYVRYSTLLHLPPLRFHCVGGCWDRTQDSCEYGIGCHTDKKENQIFLIYREIQSGAVAKSSMRKGA